MKTETSGKGLFSVRKLQKMLFSRFLRNPLLDSTTASAEYRPKDERVHDVERVDVFCRLVANSCREDLAPPVTTYTHFINNEPADTKSVQE